MYLNKYIFSYNEIVSLLDGYACDSNYAEIFRKEKSIGTTTFGYDILNYSLGVGKEHVILLATTHGCEIVTTYYILEFITTVLCEKKKYNDCLNAYTFHIIPVLNPEGYIISSSNVIHNVGNMNPLELKKFSAEYLRRYNIDDYNATHCKEVEKKLYKTLMQTSVDYIDNISLRESVKKILTDTNLDSSVLPVWSSNGMGIDLNANSIHQFNSIKAQKERQKYGKLRYNDISVTLPSPHGYFGKSVFDKDCPENIALYDYVTSLYEKLNKGNNKSERLIAFFSYHSTGGEIYGYPDKNHTTTKQVLIHKAAMKSYNRRTNYKIICEKTKYNVMDYYRIALEDVVTLTIELSRLNGNPIGPFADIQYVLDSELKNNMTAMFAVLSRIN